MVLAATLYATADAPRRDAPRRSVHQKSTLRDPALKPVDVLVHDLSIGGLRLIAAAELPLDSIVWIGLPGVGRVESRIVRREGDEYGCTFLEPIREAAVENAFRGESVVDLGATRLPGPAELSPDVADQRWPPALRVAFIVGVSGLLWAGIFGLFLL